MWSTKWTFGTTKIIFPFCVHIQKQLSFFIPRRNSAIFAPSRVQLIHEISLLMNNVPSNIMQSVCALFFHLHLFRSNPICFYFFCTNVIKCNLNMPSLGVEKFSFSLFSLQLNRDNMAKVLVHLEISSKDLNQIDWDAPEEFSNIRFQSCYFILWFTFFSLFFNNLIDCAISVQQ